MKRFSNLWILLLLLLPTLGHAAGEAHYAMTWYRDITLSAWQPTSTISSIAATNGGAYAASGTWWYAVSPTNSLGYVLAGPATNIAVETNQLVVIRWTPIGGASGYRVWRGTNATALTEFAASASTQYVDYGTNTWTAGTNTNTVVFIPQFYLLGDPLYSNSAVSKDYVDRITAYGKADSNWVVATFATLAAMTATNNAQDLVINSKLGTSEWAVADSTTNPVRRTGDTMTGSLTIDANEPLYLYATNHNTTQGQNYFAAFQTYFTLYSRVDHAFDGAFSFTTNGWSTRFISGVDSTKFEADFLGNAYNLTNFPDSIVSNSSYLAGALAGKMDQASQLTGLTIVDHAYVGTNKTSLTAAYTGQLGDITVITGICEVTAGKTYVRSFGRAGGGGTAEFYVAGTTLTNGTTGLQESNQFTAAVSTGLCYLTLYALPDVVPIVTNLTLRELPVGPLNAGTGNFYQVNSGGPIHAGGNLTAANYSDNMRLLTNAQDILLGKSSEVNTGQYGVAIGYLARDKYTGGAGGIALGFAAYSAIGVAVGYAATGSYYAAAVGDHATASWYGSSFGNYAAAENYGVGLGASANGSQTNIAVGYRATALGGSMRIAMGASTTNEVDDSAVLRGTLYLDGGTAVLYRATFGSGTWVQLGGSGAETDPIWTAAKTNYPMLGTSTGCYPIGTLIQQDAGATCWVGCTASRWLIVATNSPTTIAVSSVGTNYLGTMLVEVRANTNTIAYDSMTIKNVGPSASTAIVARADYTVLFHKQSFTNKANVVQFP